MAILIEMTQLSPTMTEGTVVSWIKKAGDSISPGDILAEVETDKAVMEMESYDSGTLLAILAEPGTKVGVGLPLAILGEKGEDVSQLIKEAKEKLASKSKTSPEPASIAKPNIDSQNKQEPPIKEETIPKQAVQEKESNPENIATNIKSNPLSSSSNQPRQEVRMNTGRILASPLAKSLAIEKSIDLKYLNGSGPGGRILQRDIYSYIESGGQKHTVSYGEVAHDKSIPVSGMRKIIAERLTSSKQNLPHFYLNIEIDAEPLVEYREKINEALEALFKAEERETQPSSDETDKIGSIKSRPSRISINDLIVKATALSIEKHPKVNASWQGETILEKGSIDIGIAVSIEDGLLTPVLRNANQMRLDRLSTEIRSLASRAKNRKLKPEEYTGSSFTISNLGMYGIQFFTAIINEPESAILAVGSVEEKPVVKNGSIVPGKTLSLTLSCDHRVIDGAEGAKFLGSLRRFLEVPELLAT
jgi:pyruvate dehydrogenase E2 component (dihydrolipoamide acetyltransferase)